MSAGMAGVHAFLLDTVVAPKAQRKGIARQMVAMAVAEARRAGCEWLHVDFDDHLKPLLRQVRFQADCSRSDQTLDTISTPC